MSSSIPKSAGSIPSIRTFQMSGGRLGQLDSSVNLFRGDINLPQKLFSLPARNQDSGLDLDLSIMYQSNVYRDAKTWNREAPTGVLGLGWALPLTYIEAESNGSPARNTWDYTLYDNGSANALVRQAEAHVLFPMAGSLADELQDGAAVPDDIRQSFLDHGLPLSDTARVDGTTSEWVLVDDALQQHFLLTLTDDQLIARDGGEIFQALHFGFEKILYYPDYERWLLVTAEGVRKSFGGLTGETSEGYKQGINNSIAWDVWWGKDGEPVWKGPSRLTTGQIQVARAWHLTSISDRFGDSVTYRYNNWDREDGLIPWVEQLVGGPEGKPYTKAVYLTELTDVFGRTVTFTYGEKLWGSGESEPREYADPHRAQPGNEPNAYQDRYETRYLDHLQALDSTGQTMFTMTFAYNPGAADSPVANVTDNTGALLGDTYKRYLTGITLLDADGDAQPGFLFDYYLDAQSEAAQPGALMRMTWPQGGQATYEYEKKALQVCERKMTVRPPEDMDENGTAPRLFFGPDYVVSTWFNSLNGDLSMRIYSWYGTWLQWEMQDGPILDGSGGIDRATLSVEANADFFALHFETHDDTKVYIFAKDPARPAQWVPAEINEVTTAPSQPTLTYPISSREISYRGGDNFFVVVQMSASSSGGTYDLITWRWSSRTWEQVTIECPIHTWLTTGAEYLLALDWDGMVSLRYQDGNQNWMEGGSLQLDGFEITNADYLEMANDASMVALSRLIVDNQQDLRYEIYLLRWDTGYRFIEHHATEITDHKGQDSEPNTWIPQIISNTLVGINGNLLRFNGADWLSNANFQPGSPQPGSSQRYAYGPDYALQIIEVSGNATAKVHGFNPESDSSAWVTEPSETELALPHSSHSYDNWPAGGNEDFMALGPYLYYRGVATNWGEVVQASPLANISDLAGQAAADYTLNSQSLLNAGPDFLAYNAQSTTSPDQHVQTLLLENGKVLQGEAVVFENEEIYYQYKTEGGAAGTLPQGPQTFVSYPSRDSDFDRASEVYLYRYVGDQVAGPITHFPVARTLLDDGYQIAVTSYVPDSESAGCDPSGMVIKYYKNTVYPGTAEPAQATPNGYTINYFLNGLNELAGTNFHNMLDGLELRKETWDSGGNLKASQENGWSIYEQVASDPIDGTAPTITLRGGWVCQSGKSTMSDGVTRSEASEYIPQGMSAPYTGQPSRAFTVSYGGNGVTETFARVYSYGVEVNPALRALNLLSAEAQVLITRDTGNEPVTLQSTATTYRSWPCAAMAGVQVPAKEASFRLLTTENTHFPFATYDPETVPVGWQRDERILSLTERGQVRENQDANGVTTTTHYSRDLEFSVAEAPNCPALGMAYLGFEDYEDLSSWRLEGTTTEDSDAYTGKSSILLPGGAAASIATSITPENRSQIYLLGCWYKTQPGYSQTPGSGWQLTVQVDGVASPPVNADFESTNGEWSFKSLGLPLTAGTTSLTIDLQVSNTTDSDVLLDSLYLVPLTGGITARTYHGPDHQVTSTMEAGGRLQWSRYDRFQRSTLQIGADGQVRELSQRYLSRRGNQDHFNANDPNGQLTLHPANGGRAETFRDGNDWQTRWTAEGSWQNEDGTLSFSGSSGNSLSAIENLPEGGASAIYFEVSLGDTTPALTLSAGGCQVSWQEGSGWSASLGSALPCLASPTGMARHWLLLRLDGGILFFGDGQLLFSATGTVTAERPMLTPTSAITLRNLAVMHDCRLGISFEDAAGRKQQVQQLSGMDSRIITMVYDSLGRRLAVTKAIPGSFGSGAGLPLLQYRPDLLDRQAFIEATADSWQMTGDVADYYNGTQSGASDDEGYPYLGIRWEDTPRKKRLEIGRPGLTYAIHDIEDTSTEDRATLQISYGTNSGDDDLPAGKYQEIRITSPVKTVTSQITDQLGQQVSVRAMDPIGTTVGRSGGLRAYSEEAGSPRITLTLQTPNALDDGQTGPQTNPENYITTTTNNALDNSIARTDPDTGATRFMYDPNGRLRFVLPARGESETWFIYYKYDPLGRMTEQGRVFQAWDEADLEESARQPEWPEAGTNYEATIEISYDGDGNDATLVGQKVQVVTLTEAPETQDQRDSVGEKFRRGRGRSHGHRNHHRKHPRSSRANSEAELITTESFGYDTAGRLVRVTLNLSGATETEGTVTYAYNNLGEITSLNLPEGSPTACVTYSYNDQGRVSQIRDSDRDKTIATYAYDVQGNVARETLGDGAWTRTVTYEPTGWVKQVATTSANGERSLTLSYEHFEDGNLRNRTVAYQFEEATETLTDSYTYDGQGRMTTAEGSSDLLIESYDPNGNIWQLTQDGQAARFDCQPGNDRLAQTTVGNQVESVAYDESGFTNLVMGSSLDYDPVTNTTTGVTNGSTAVRYGYGDQQKRVYKSVNGVDTVYFRGPSTTPLLRRDGDSWQALIQGPTGLVAILEDDQTYYPLKDETQTAWALVDENSLVGRYVYLPFGTQTLVEGPSPEKLKNRYMGQEWDEEVGLYHFGARMYHPVLRRFLAPDPALQYPSPYMFCGNNPMAFVDPTGSLSQGAQIGIGVAMSAVAAGGMILSMITLGAAAPAVAGAEAALAAVEVGAEVGVEVAAEVAVEGAVAGAVEGAAEGAVAAGAEAVAGTTEVAAGAAAGAVSESAAVSASKTATKVGFLSKSNLSYLGQQAGAGAISGAGTSGLMYDIEHGRDFSAKGFFTAMGIGALSGFISSGLGSLSSMPASRSRMTSRGWSGRRQIAVQIAAKGVSGALGSDLSTALTNITQGESWYEGLVKSSLTGFAENSVSAALGEIAKSDRVATLIDRVKAALDDDQILACKTVGTLTLVDGYAVWGIPNN